MMSEPLPRESRTARTDPAETEGTLDLEEVNWEREKDLEVGSRQDPKPPQMNAEQD